MTSRRKLGDFGERIAVTTLESAGLTVVNRNVRVRGGEIDLLAEDGDDVVFVEVRTRKAAEGAAVESLSPAKLRRMWRCAMAHCEESGIDPERARLDVVSVDLDARGRVQNVFHYRGMELDGDDD